MTGQAHTYKWGIQGYRVPLTESQVMSPAKISFTKEKGQTYMDKIIKLSESKPDPCKYSKTLQWKGPLGVLKGGKRNTFLDEAIKSSSKLPGPNTYSPIKKFKKTMVKIGTSEKDSHLADIEFVAAALPGPVYTPKKEIIMKRIKSVKVMPIGKNDYLRTSSTLEKNDTPNPCSYTELEKALNLVKTNSPKFRFPKGRRTMFTDDIEKNKSKSPSPDAYKSIDESKIYKVMAKNRRY